MMRRESFFFLAVLCAATTARGGEPSDKAPAVLVRGRVLLDANPNGVVDPADQGLAGVLVSDGIQLVKTAADGAFELKFRDDPLIPYRPAQVLCVCWPTGVWPVGGRFFVRRADIDPARPVDFLLAKVEQKVPFSFAHATDPHDNLSCGKELFGDDVRRMQEHVAFCLMTGDLGYAGRDNAEKMFAAIREVTRGFPVPLLHAPGNHDIVDIHTMRWSAQDALAGYGPYTKHLGPIRFSFNYAGVHFVSLDWARILPDGKLETGVPDGAIDWLEKDLRELPAGTRIFVFMHHDFRPGDDRFWDLLVKHKVERVLAGHSHRNKEESRRGIPRLTTQNLCGPYRLLTVEAKGHAIVNRCYAGNAASHRHSYAGKCKMTLDPKFFSARHGPRLEVAARMVRGIEVLEGFQAREMEIGAEAAPGRARSFGLRLGTGDSAIELTMSPAEDTLSLVTPRAATLRTAAVRGRGDEGYKLRVIVVDGKIVVYVNNRVHLERAAVFATPVKVTLFSEGGPATFSRLEAAEIKGMP